MSKDKEEKNKIGRPRAFTDIEKLKSDIEAYFKECDDATGHIVTKQGEVVEVPDPTPYTIEGLSDHLGVTRATLLNYQKKSGYEDFFYTITRAKAKVQRDISERGLSRKSDANMSKFILSNNFDGYVDKQQIEHSGGINRFEIVEDDSEPTE